MSVVSCYPVREVLHFPSFSMLVDPHPNVQALLAKSRSRIKKKGHINLSLLGITEIFFYSRLPFFLLPIGILIDISPM